MKGRTEDVYTWAVTSIDVGISVILASITMARGIADLLLFGIIVTLPFVGVGYAKGYGSARALNILIGVTLFVYFISVNYHLIILPSLGTCWVDMVSVILGTVLSILLLVLTLYSQQKRVL